MLAALLLQASPTLRWLRRLGGPGLFLLGIGDSSPLPLPGGSADLLILILAARRQHGWAFYALLATAGSVIGSYLAYRAAAGHGARALEHRLGETRAHALFARLNRHGVAIIAAGAILPPPFPFTAVVMAAGAGRFPLRRFLTALAPARFVRYAVAAYLGNLYGRSIVRAFRNYQPTPPHIAEALAILAAIAVAAWFLHHAATKPPRPHGS